VDLGPVNIGLSVPERTIFDLSQVVYMAKALLDVALKVTDLTTSPFMFNCEEISK
jgi:hypothetical protein